MPEAWLVSRDKPILTAPSGRTFRMSDSREMAVAVMRTLIAEVAKRDWELPALLAVAHPTLSSAMMQFCEVALEEGEAAFGETLAQYLDVIAWELTWADAGVEVRHA